MAGFHAALRAYHVMVGTDPHQPWVPGTPAPSPAPAPYKTYALMMGAIPLTTKQTTSVFSDGTAPLMLRGTDIGPLIPHAGPPSLTLMLEILTSGSKTHFGASKVHVRDQRGTQGNVGVALLGAVGINLNCGTPMPSLASICALTTLRVGLSVGDVVSGACLIAFDACVQGILHAFGNGVGDLVSSMVERVANRLGIGILRRVPARQLARKLGVRSNIRPTASALQALRAKRLAASATTVRVGVNLAIGSPLGISVSSTHDDGIISVYDVFADHVDPEAGADRLGGAVDGYLNSPSVEELPAGGHAP